MQDFCRKSKIVFITQSLWLLKHTRYAASFLDASCHFWGTVSRGEKDSEETRICDANAGRRLTSRGAAAKRAAVILGTRNGCVRKENRG